MKKIILALAAVVGFAGAAVAQDSISGIWQTEVDDGSFAHIVIAPCGAAFCGTLQRSFYADGTEYDSPNKGQQIVRQMRQISGNTFEGEVYRPANQKVYFGTIEINGNSLQLKGCLTAAFGGAGCARQNWQRAG